jgi:hypothetical protein
MDEDLSEQQIQQLLKDAEDRLRAAKANKGSKDASSALLQRYAIFQERPRAELC